MLRDLGTALHLRAAPGTHTTHQALEALLGRTRANALDAIAGGCTTSRLAGRLGVSLATASHHATVLRDAGLIVTHREGRSVLHTLTALGADLLNGRSLSRPG